MSPALFAFLLAVPGAPAAQAGDPPRDRPVLLNALASHSPAAPRKGAGYVILTDLAEEDPYRAALRRLAEFRKVRHVLTFTGPDVEALLPSLRELKPRHVAVVVRPETIDVNFHYGLLEMSTRLDDDPFPDFHFGYVTGATPEEALAFVERILRAEKGKGRLPRRIVSFGPSESEADSSVGDDGSFSWARGFRARKLRHGTIDFLGRNLGQLEGAGILSAWGHGMPEGVGGGLLGRHLREWKPDLFPSLFFSTPCYTGVVRRWHGEAGGKAFEEVVKPDESFALAVLASGATGLVAGLDPDRGETSEQELEHLLLAGAPLGGAVKSTYDKVVVARRQDAFRVLRYEAGKPAPERSLLDGAAGRAAFGDPAFQPFGRTGNGPFRTRCEAVPGGLLVTIEADALASSFWSSVDIYHGSEWTHWLYDVVELRGVAPERLRELRVLEVRDASGTPVPHEFPTAAVEAWEDVLRLHVLVVLPGRPLADGAVTARLRVGPGPRK